MTNGNILIEDDNDLVLADYNPLLEQIAGVLAKQNPFKISGDRQRLLADIDAIATEVANSEKFQHPLGASARNARAATINFSDPVAAEFRKAIRGLRATLSEHLQSALGEATTLEQFAASLMATDLASFQGPPSDKLALTYDFKKVYGGLEKQQLSLRRENRPGSESILKLHKLAIAVQNTGQFDDQLRQGLENYFKSKGFSEEELEDLQESLEDLIDDRESDYYRILRLMDTEALGKLKREAQIKYLEYLLELLQDSREPDRRTIYLQDLIRRLRLLDEYLNNPDEDDEHYEVSYAGVTVNFRDIFAESNSLDALPIITIIDGYLGETSDDTGGDRQFIFGLKLKFGGAVQARGGKEVFDYYLDLINPDSEVHKTNIAADSYKRQYFVKKIFKLLCLYYFVLKNFGNINYEPELPFGFDFLSIFQKATEKQREDFLRELVRKDFGKESAKDEIHQLRELLQKLLDRKTIVPPRHYDFYISVSKDILEANPSNIENGQFFKSILSENYKAALKFIAVGPQSVASRALCQLPVRLSIEDVRYFIGSDRQEFRMEYDIEGVKVLPAILTPKDDLCRTAYKNSSFPRQKAIVLSYDLEAANLEDAKAFVYRFTYILLAYLALKILLKHAPSKFFLPILRLHKGDKRNPEPNEEFMASFSKVLSHLLNEEHRSNSQGFRVRTLAAFTIRNGLMSLYSVLPKTFHFSGAAPASQPDKLAIIIVSSKESDVRRGGTSKIVSLMGEVIGISADGKGAIAVEMHKTFADNENIQRLSSNPTAIVDEVERLYSRGYRHFLYIAKAPYSRTLNITQQQGDDEGLFFLSRQAIAALKGDRSDIKIYPVFFDKYYVRKLETLKSSSFYIPQTLELASLLEDPSKKTVVFFNLFNGLGVRGDSFYNGVISYATPLNIYKGILEDEDIRQGLISDTTLKETLLQYITFFHFSRYEAYRKISPKLDPYQSIIGDEAVGKQSVFSHASGGSNFNILAFLTQVKEILNAD